MTPAQRAILAKAKKDGLKPSEQASEFLLHDVVEACLSQLRNYSVAWKNLSEKEQDASIASMTDSLKETVTDTIRILIAAGTSAIPFKLKSLTIDGKLKVTGHVEGDHPERHALTDKAHDKSEILLILSPRDYFEGLEAIQGERDQKSLPLDEEPAPKAEKAVTTTTTKTAKTSTGKTTNVADIASAVAFKAGEVEKARQFVNQFRLPTVAGVQQAIPCGYNKGEAILNELVRLGEVIKNEDGSFQMPSLGTDEAAPEETVLGVEPDGAGGPPPFLDGGEADPEIKPAKPLTKAQQKKADAAAAKAEAVKIKEEDDPDFSGSSLEWGDLLTDAMYEKIRAEVVKTQKVSAGALAVKFDIPITIADEAIDRLEMNSVISELDDAGMREVFDQPE